MKKPKKPCLEDCDNCPFNYARKKRDCEFLDVLKVHHDYETWLKELIPKEKKVPECLNDASVGDYEIGFNDAITEIKKKLKHRR